MGVDKKHLYNCVESHLLSHDLGMPTMASLSELIWETLLVVLSSATAENWTEYIPSEEAQMVKVWKVKPKHCSKYLAKYLFQNYKTV